MGGKITGISKGTATITAKTEDGDFVANIEVIVEEKKQSEVKVTNINLNKQKIVMQEGEKDNKIIVKIEPENATNKNIMWTSSDESIATVDQSGIITAKKTGTVIITAKTEDGTIKSSCELTVNPKTNKEDDIYQEEIKTKEPEKVTTSHKVLPFAGHNKTVFLVLVSIIIVTIIILGYKNIKYKGIK